MRVTTLSRYQGDTSASLRPGLAVELLRCAPGSRAKPPSLSHAWRAVCWPSRLADSAVPWQRYCTVSGFIRLMHSRPICSREALTRAANRAGGPWPSARPLHSRSLLLRPWIGTIKCRCTRCARREPKQASDNLTLCAVQQRIGAPQRIFLYTSCGNPIFCICWK